MTWPVDGVSAADAMADLDHVEALLIAAHPARTRFVTDAELAAAFDRERSGLARSDGVTELELGAALHRVLARLGDAHVHVGLPVYKSDGKDVSLLPVTPRTIEGRVLVDSATAIYQSGTELVAIDGVDVATAWREVSSLIPADGRDPVAVRAALEHDLPKWWALARGMSATYAVTVRLPGGDVRTDVLAGLDRADARALAAARRSALWSASSADRLPGLSRVGDRAVLQIPTFGVADTATFRAVVDAAFADLAPGEPLVVDLRGNEGGLRVNANVVLDHLLPGPYAEWSSMRVVTRGLPAALRTDLTWLAGSDEERLRPLFRGPRARDGWTVSLDPYASTPPGPPHTGALEVWVDGRTGSAANGFATIVARELPAASIVGERTGGGCDAHVGELPVVWTSPRTGVAVLFSLIALTHLPSPGCVPGAGLPPEVAVTPTVADFVAGVDPWAAARR